MSVPITMNEPVLVKAKYLRRSTVCVEFEVVDKQWGDDPSQRDIRHLSRSYTFDEVGEARMPLKMAKILLEKQPNDFKIVESLSDNEEVREEIAKIQRKASRAERKADIPCTYCQHKAKSKAGLSSHIRYKHPKQFEELYKKK